MEAQRIKGRPYWRRQRSHFKGKGRRPAPITPSRPCNRELFSFNFTLSAPRGQGVSRDTPHTPARQGLHPWTPFASLGGRAVPCAALRPKAGGSRSGAPGASSLAPLGPGSPCAPCLNAAALPRPHRFSAPRHSVRTLQPATADPKNSPKPEAVPLCNAAHGPLPAKVCGRAEKICRHNPSQQYSLYKGT